MRLAGTLVSIVAGLLPAMAGAVELRVGIATEGVYDSNVTRTKDGVKDDGSFRFSPTFRISSQDRKFGVDFSYIPTYEAFVTYTDLNDLTHRLTNSLSYSVTEKTDLSLNSYLSILEVLNAYEYDVIEGDTPIPSEDVSRSRVLLYGSTFNIEHAFNSRWVGDTDIGFSLFNSDRENSVDSKTVSAIQSFSYALTAADRVGGGGGAVVQMFDEIEGLPASTTAVYRLFGSYVRNFGERTSLSVRVGPALISTYMDEGTGRSEFTYPYVGTGDMDTTVGALRNRNVPIIGFDDSTAVPANSVVVPNTTNCSGLTGSNQVVFNPDTCPFERLLRRNLAGAENVDDIIDGIQGQTTAVAATSVENSQDLRFTLFGAVTLTHSWTPNLVSSIAYDRSENTASGNGATAIADTVSLRTTWRPSELWDVSVLASWVKRKSPSSLSRSYVLIEDDTVSGANGDIDLVMLNGQTTVVSESTSVDTQRWSAALRVARRLTRHLTATARLSYSKQDSANSDRNPNNFGDFTAAVGIKYDFDPFRF